MKSFDKEAWKSAVGGDPLAGRTEATRAGRARMADQADAKGFIKGLTQAQLANRLGFTHGASAERYTTALERSGYLKTTKPGQGGHRASPAEYKLTMPRRAQARGHTGTKKGASPPPRATTPCIATRDELASLSDEQLELLSVMLHEVRLSRGASPVAA